LFPQDNDPLYQPEGRDFRESASSGGPSEKRTTGLYQRAGNHGVSSPEGKKKKKSRSLNLREVKIATSTDKELRQCLAKT